ncbi:hypothetical protein WJX84_002446 [Apatococcus fuscideae]|uniref:Uncharacterized protein n=1 Tax=Apatococcus fuscideae TaxID=2026836 RepID=A0AAW1TAF2_9CHLO
MDPFSESPSPSRQVGDEEALLVSGHLSSSAVDVEKIAPPEGQYSGASAVFGPGSTVLRLDFTFWDWEEAYAVPWQDMQKVMKEAAGQEPWKGRKELLFARAFNLGEARNTLKDNEGDLGNHELMDVRIIDWHADPGLFVDLQQHCQYKMERPAESAAPGLQEGDEEALLAGGDRPSSAGVLVESAAPSERTSSSASAVFNLGNTIVGAGIMFSEKLGATSYPQLVQGQLGLWGNVYLQLSIILNNAGIMTVYLIILGDITVGSAPLYGGLLSSWFGLDAGSTWRLDMLGGVSAVSLGLAALFASISILLGAYAAAKRGLDGIDWWPDWSRPTSVLATLPILTTSYVCHFNLHPLMKDLKDYTTKRMLTVVEHSRLHTSFLQCSSSKWMILGGIVFLL